MIRIKSFQYGFTLTEVLLASTASAVILATLCMAYQYSLNRWDVITCSGIAMSSADTALERIEKDARSATGFTTSTVSGNTLYIFTLPANTNGSGQYIPQRVGGSLSYVNGPQVCFYLSDITGSQSVTNGTILWRGTAPAGSSTFTKDSSWSLVNTSTARCDNMQTFNITTSGMPQHTVQVNISLSNTSGHKSSTYTISRNIYMMDTMSASTGPANLVATGASGSISLTWTAVGGATSYNVYRSTSAGTEGSTAYATGVTSASYTDTTVTGGTTYYYMVSAIINGTESAYSNEASATASNVGYVTVTHNISSLSNWWGEEQLVINNTSTITSMTVTHVITKTTGLSYAGMWNSFWGGYITQTYVNNSGNITYTAVLNNGDWQTSGTYTIANQFNLTGTAHSTTGDTYTVVVTAGGVTQTLTGHF